MKKSTKNIFKGGDIKDVHVSAQPNDTTRGCSNFRLITRDNNSFVRTTVKGNELEDSITENYIPIAIDDRNGVAYIISAEVIDGVATGRGEIGSFPSPNPLDDTLIYVYSPLMNYGGDGDEFVDLDGPFNSEHFDFDLENLLDIELQNDYDASVNIIFTDGKSPVRIVNSGFTVLPGLKYSIADRSLAKDTNKYSADNFSNTLNLILKTKNLSKVTFNESTDGGNVGFGNVQYFFAYSTMDGNETEIFAQSMIVPVFNGNTFMTIGGGKNTGEKSSKQNRLTISNIDTSFSHIVAYCVHADGMNSKVITSYRINKKYIITGTSLEFIHSGFEEVINVPITVVQDTSVSIDTAKSLTQAQGHLILANIKEKVYEKDALERFAKLIRIGHKEITMDIIGPELHAGVATSGAAAGSMIYVPGYSRYTEPLSNVLKSGTDGYNGGYLNPKNVHDKTGYWGGESIPFAVRFIYPDGTPSGLFPATAIDNVLNDNLATVDTASEATIDALLDTDGFSVDGKLLNAKGVYRFPNRNGGASGALFSLVTVGNRKEARIKVNGVTFKIPALTFDLGDGATITDYTIGIQFFRGERIKDAIAQGLFIDTEIVPPIAYDDAATTQQINTYSAYSTSNFKLVPMFNRRTEGSFLYDTYGSDQKRSSVDADADKVLISARFTNAGRNRTTYLSGYDPFCFLSSDAIIDPASFSGFASKDIFAKMLYTITHRTRVRSLAYKSILENGETYCAAIPILATNSALSSAAQTSWVAENSDEVNDLKFATRFRAQGRPSGVDKYTLFRQQHNNYLGIRMLSNTVPSIGDEGPSTTAAFSIETDNLHNDVVASYIGNLYPGAAQRTQGAIQALYQDLSNVKYFPISDKIYWNEDIPGADADNSLEDQLDVNRKITLFGGDCYINFMLRKLYKNYENDALDGTFSYTATERPRTGLTLGLVNEANINCAFRSVEVVDVAEGLREFPQKHIVPTNHPFGNILGVGNPWRDYQKFESNRANLGYGMTDGNLKYAINDGGLFVNYNWFSRVWASPKNIPNSYENAYRKFLPGDYQDYDAKNGEIIKLISCNGKLFCIQKGSVGVIPMNERIQTGGDSAGAIYVESSGLLGPFMGMISEEYGSQHKGSVVATDNHVYGIDLEKLVIWKEDNGILELMSDLTCRSFLEKYFASLTNPEIEILTHNIHAIWDKKNGEVLFSLYNKEDEDYDSGRNQLLAYNETGKRFHTDYLYNPLKFFRVGQNLYSFNVKQNRNEFWKHDSETAAYCSFYGEDGIAKIAFVVNADSDINKVFDNLEIISNRCRPTSINYSVQGAETTQTLVDIPGDIIASNIKYKNESWRLAIPKVAVEHDLDIEKQEVEAQASAASLLKVKSRLKGRNIIIELVYENPTLVELQAVITTYQQMQ